jgi:hypothetical protein
MSLSTILSNPHHWTSHAAWEANEIGSRKISISNILQAIEQAPWTGDSFQNPVLISTLCKFNKFEKKSNVKFCMAVENLLEHRSRLSLHRSQPLSSYLRFQNVRALLAVVETDSVPNDILSSQRIGYALERANMVSFDELCRQLAFFSVGDSVNFDEITLTYSLLTYWVTSQSLFLSSFARGVVPLTNIKLIQTALKVVFESQKEDGTWNKGEPINKTGVHFFIFLILLFIVILAYFLILLSFLVVLFYYFFIILKIICINLKIMIIENN